MTRKEYYSRIPHYCEYPQPDNCNLVLGCWGILYNELEQYDYCRSCDCKVMAKRKIPHNKRMWKLLIDRKIKYHETW